MSLQFCNRTIPIYSFYTCNLPTQLLNALAVLTLFGEKILNVLLPNRYRIQECERAFSQALMEIPMSNRLCTIRWRGMKERRPGRLNTFPNRLDLRISQSRRQLGRRSTEKGILKLIALWLQGPALRLPASKSNFHP
ncbi:hypothetical protein WJ70_28710 [Burkholderia ubonensis]|nr:hypothetical protein WJ70_28710 [Burkholderia ubonensis]